MNFVQPSIDPVILSIGFIDIRWYSLAYIFGLISGLIIMKKLNMYKGYLIDNNKIDNFFIWAVLGIVIGGRAGYVLFYQMDLFVYNPLYIFEIWNGGMSFHGGLIGVVISIFLFSRINNLNFYFLSDLVCVVAPIGIFLGRMANFINTELIGRPTEFFISVIFPSIDNIPRHPSQIYEAFFEGVILFVILAIYFIRTKEFYKTGIITGLFLCLYSFFRFLIEFLREPDLHIGLMFNFFSMGQILSIPVFFIGFIIILANANKKRY